MAIVKIQAPLVGIRGKYGGMVFSANGSGPYAKRWSMPVNKKTAPQTSKRGWFATIQHAWGQLTQEQVDDWAALALDPPELDYNSLAEQIWLSGAAWHMRVNMRRLQAGQAIEDDCPVNLAVDPATSFTMEVYEFGYAAGVDLFGYTDGDFATGYAVLQVATVMSTVKQVQTSGFKSIWCGTVEQATWTRINEELAVAFGWLSVGNKLFGRLLRQSTTGIRSVALETSCLVLAEP